MTMTRAEIETLLDRLEECVAEDLEGQHIDFKEWGGGGSRGQLQRVVRAAVCMANGGGGTVVFGVADGVAGRDRAVVGVPYHVNTGPLGAQMYDGTDPKLTPVFEEIEVSEGTRRLIVMHVHPGIPPYTDTAGRGAVRVGKDCQPLTGSLRRALNEESAGSDYTAETVEVPLSSVLSGAATEALREAAKRERASEALIACDNQDLLEAVGAADEGRPTRAAVLLAGSSAAMRRHVPRCVWTYVRMTSDTDYSERARNAAANAIRPPFPHLVAQGGWVGCLRALPRIIRRGMRLEMRFAHYSRIYNLERSGNATENARRSSPGHGMRQRGRCRVRCGRSSVEPPPSELKEAMAEFDLPEPEIENDAAGRTVRVTLGRAP